ncbi:MAG: O-antigen ligase family protein [Kiritimatiellaeota bacterium]|nr:O-antigen ligase family protein [Kiritimatiellota bacterium]
MRNCEKKKCGIAGLRNFAISQFRDFSSWTAFLCAVFASGFSMPVSRAFLIVSLALLIREKLRESVQSSRKNSQFSNFKFRNFAISQFRNLRDNPPMAGYLAYLFIALVITVIAASTNTDPLLDPVKGLFKKFPKLLWYFAIPLGAWHINSPERAKTALKVFIGGCLVTAFTVVFYNTAAAWFQMNIPHPRRISDRHCTAVQLALRRIINAFGPGAIDRIYDWMRAGGGQARTFGGALAKLGTMGGSQRLMVALPAAVYMALEKLNNGNNENLNPRLPLFPSFPLFRKYRHFIIPAFILLALALTLKRGPLLIGVAASAIPFVRRLKWKALFIPFAAILLVAFIPPARERFMRLPDEFDTARGGRAAMWRTIAPELRREQPLGIGFRALTNDKMREIVPHIELRQTHLHSVPIQSWVDFGWLGLAAWALWMLLALRSAWQCPHPAPFAMLAALVCYGLMEYNLADADIVLLYSLAMALSVYQRDPSCARTRNPVK